MRDATDYRPRTTQLRDWFSGWPMLPGEPARSAVPEELEAWLSVDVLDPLKWRAAARPGRSEERNGRQSGPEGRGASPDGPWLARVRKALDWWESRSTSPTDAITGTGAVGQLERGVAAAAGVPYALSFPSATLGLWAAIAAIGVQPGDEIILPALDWMGTCWVARSLLLEPRFAMPARDQPTVAAETVERLISPRTRVIVVTHLWGYVADVPALRDELRRRRRHDIVVLEDAAHAFGAKLNGRPVGSMGTAACFSLGEGKLLDGGGGGIVVSDDERLFEAMVRASLHPVRQHLLGVDSSGQPSPCHRIHPVAAVLALHDLDRVGAELGARRLAAERLRAWLTERGREMVGSLPGREPSWYRAAVRGSSSPPPPTP